MKKYKLLSVLFMLVISAVALTTASYAWFTANTSVSLEGLDVNVSASNGIQISMDATNWKARLTTSDISGKAYEGAVNQVPGSLVPVSTGLTVDAATGFLNMYKGAIDTAANGSYILTATKSTETAGELDANNIASANTTAGDFIAFDVFLQATEETTINLSASSDVVTKEGTEDKGLKNAARVAFVVEGNVGVGEVAGAHALNGASEIVVWEPNSNIHTVAGISAASSTYLETISASQVVASYYGISDIILATDNVPLTSTNASYFTSVTPDIQTVVANATNGTEKTLTTIGAGITKIRVYAWIEGQDYDCENNASGSDITFNIQVSKAASVSEG